MENEKRETVVLVCGTQRIEASFVPGERVMDVVKRAGVSLDAPCGGKHTCGKCRVFVRGVQLDEIGEQERTFLSEADQSRGVRLACFAHLLAGGGEIEVPQEKRISVQESGVLRDVELAPPVRRIACRPPVATLSDQRSDAQRLCETLGEGYVVRAEALPSLAVAMEADGTVTVVCREKEILKVLPGDCTQSQYAVAVDIGTTTVVAYLIDLLSGAIVCTRSGISAQRPFGADVISRINHTMEHAEGLCELTGVLRKQIDALIADLLRESGIKRQDVDFTVLAGNTVMMHFFLGVSPKGIALAPFQPAFVDRMETDAAALRMQSFDGLVFTLPCVSGYIGSDITAGLAACEIRRDETLRLMIDIGTNGEMAIGNSKFLMGCSTAAGPAFEGAQIRCGMGGVTGAVNQFALKDGVISYRTVDGAAPCGICGSGLVDAAAALLENGVVEETGRMLEADELEEPLARYCLEVDGEPAFLIAETDSEPVVLTQRDIRQLQLAKAAIAAGIRTLLHATGRQVEEIDTIYLAGGFGSFLSRHSAAVIGLLPRELEERIVPAGNLAGMGAVLAAKSEPVMEQMQALAKAMHYIELSTSPEFQDYYMECMMFEGIEN